LVLFQLASLILEGIGVQAEKAYLEYLEHELRELRQAYYEEGQIAREDFEKRHASLMRLITSYRETTKRKPHSGVSTAF
jgi:hypothetical protein